MTRGEFDALCLALPGATRDNPWGHEDVFKVGGKMFAMPDGAGGCMFKVSDIAYEALVESGRARPAPYMARAKWVQFDNLEDLEAEEVADWLKSAHAIVAAKLTRNARRELGLI
ncbi:MAG: MmcQ/YjbR family DNA-binding protein [Caulobacterales bacterium]